LVFISLGCLTLKSVFLPCWYFPAQKGMNFKHDYNLLQHQLSDIIELQEFFSYQSTVNILHHNHLIILKSK
jgi:hypothetical protein